MKTRIQFLVSLLAVCFIFTSCSKEDSFDGGETGEDAVITVTLKGSTETRAIPSGVDDSDINSYKIYVFSLPTGVIEASKDGSSTLTTTITGLKTGTKKIVVLTNMATYPTVSNYSDLSNVGNRIDYQVYYSNITDKGYIMSGESENITLVKGSNTATVSLKRTVAKLTLGSITFDPADGHDLSLLTIKGVSAQRVAPEVTLAPITSYYTTGQAGSKHYGGIASVDTELNVLAQLYKALDDFKEVATQEYEAGKKYTFGNSFLVYPNGEANCTLLTIEADYDGETIYYPIKVNYQTTTDENTDGTFVKSNIEYVLNLTLKKIGNGTTDPEVPGEDADLDVTVEVKPWDVITQNEEW